MNHAQRHFRSSLRHNMFAVLWVIALLLASVGWATTLDISGAVIATGKVVVNSELKKVQHSSGGLIGEILVVNGQAVDAGDVVARLDATTVRGNFEIIKKGLDDLLSRRSRLVAERDGLADIEFADELRARAHETDVAAVMASESRVFQLRRHARDGQKAQLRERIAQLREQITGIEKQSRATADELVLLRTDLESVRKLWDQRLVLYARLNTLEREETKLQGEEGSLIAAIAQARGRISETQLQILQIDQDLRSEAADEMSEVDAAISEFSERKVAAQDQLDRIDIRAPQSGIVHQLAIHTIGGVIGAQETLMLIVPQSDLLVIDVRIAPRDIDQVHLGQTAFLRFAAFDQRMTAERSGHIDRISADLIVDPANGSQYYELRILLADEKDRLHLIPGMPVEAFLYTGERTILSYLLKPLRDYFVLAFRQT